MSRERRRRCEKLGSWMFWVETGHHGWGWLCTAVLWCVVRPLSAADWTLRVCVPSLIAQRKIVEHFFVSLMPWFGLHIHVQPKTRRQLSKGHFYRLPRTFIIEAQQSNKTSVSTWKVLGSAIMASANTWRDRTRQLFLFVFPISDMIWGSQVGPLAPVKCHFMLKHR